MFVYAMMAPSSVHSYVCREGGPCTCEHSLGFDIEGGEDFVCVLRWASSSSAHALGSGLRYAGVGGKVNWALRVRRFWVDRCVFFFWCCVVFNRQVVLY